MAEQIIIISDEEMPLLKRALAKKLHLSGMHQTEISNILSMTQPMVSKHLSSGEEIPHRIRDLANIIQPNPGICFSSCVTQSSRHGRYLLAQDSEIISSKKQAAAEELEAAVRLIIGLDVSRILPKVRMNIAYGIEADSYDDVASLLEGFTVMKNKVISHSGITFGKRHLSSLLVDLGRTLSINSIMNIKYDETFLKKLKHSVLTKDYQLRDSNQSRALVHKGDFGIEPCIYIIGRTPKEVIDTVMSLIR